MSGPINGTGTGTVTGIVEQTTPETEPASCKQCGGGRTVKVADSTVGIGKAGGNGENGVAAKGAEEWTITKEDGKSIISGNKNKLSDTSNDNDVEMDISVGNDDDGKSELKTSRKSVLLGKMEKLAGGIKKKGKSLLAKGAKKLGGRLKAKGKSLRKYGITKKNKIVSMLPEKVANGVALNVLSPKSLKERVIGSVSKPKTLVQQKALARVKKETREAFDAAGVAPTKGIQTAKSQLKVMQQNLKETQNAHNSELTNYSVHDFAISQKETEIADLQSLSTKSITKTIIAKEKELYKKQLSTYKEKSKDVAVEIKTLKKSAKKLKTELQDVEKDNKMKEKKREVSELEDAIAELESIGDSENGMVELEGETFDLAEMKKELEAKQEELDTLDTKVTKLETQLDDVNAARETKKKKSSDLAKSIRQNKRDFDRKSNAIRQVKR